MSTELRELYEELGYGGLKAAGIPQRSVVDFDKRTVTAAPAAVPLAALPPGVAPPAPPPPVEIPDHEPLPPGPETVAEMEAFLQRDPEAALARARDIMGAEVTAEVMQDALGQLRRLVENPGLARASVMSHATFLRATARKVVIGFPDETPLIDIDPSEKKFQPVADALGWFWHCAGSFIAPYRGRRESFRWHTDPAFPSRFTYALPDPTAANPLSIALFADFGTGLYHSRYIARQIVNGKFPVAIHLGDVYYAGSSHEFREYFRGPLDPLLPTTQLFTLASNHEMYAKGVPFFDYIEDRRLAYPATQVQEGSYFRLRMKDFQIIGIDTDYFERHRYRDPDLVGWLESVLLEGRSAGQMNILLTPDEPFDFGGGATKLARDLDSVLRVRKLADLVLWGNVHHCALYKPSDDFPFYGSCIGHGGFPYKRITGDDPREIFVERRSRFPAHRSDLPHDRGNNGFCVMTLGPGGTGRPTVHLQYRDWMSNVRCDVDITRGADGIVRHENLHAEA